MLSSVLFLWFFLQVQLYKLESISQYFENFCLMTEFQTNQFIRQSVHKNANSGAV